jgi:hypothetical protein
MVDGRCVSEVKILVSTDGDRLIGLEFGRCVVDGRHEIPTSKKPLTVYPGLEIRRVLGEVDRWKVRSVSCVVRHGERSALRLPVVGG